MDKTRKLILGMLVASTALSAGAISFSLAWYNASTRLSVRYIQLDIDADRELQIKPVQEESTEYVSELSKEDLHYVTAFDAVSTMFEDNWNSESAVDPQFYSYKSFFVPESGRPYLETMHEGFLMQHFYIMGDDDLYVSLDPLTSVITPDYDFNYARASALAGDARYIGQYTVDELYERLNGLEKAMRFSIYDIEEHKNYIFDPNKEGITYYGGILDNDGEDPYFDYYTHGGVSKEVVYGEYNDIDLIRYDEEPLPADIPTTGETNCFNAKHKKGVYRFNEEASYEAGFRFKEEPSIDLKAMPKNSDIKANPFLLKCYRNTPKEIVICVYLEGWDKDCVNAVMGASFLSKLQFKIVREM